MKTTIIHLFAALFISAIVLSCGSNGSTQKKEEAVPFASLKERSAALSASPDWAIVRSKADALFQKIKADPADQKSKLLLAQLYMQEARITGEHPYYYPATLVILDDVLKYDPGNFEALAFTASVQLSLHHFNDALETGIRAMNINSNNGFIFGVLCDANVELGNYEEAVKMSDLMQGIRPGLESYSRASYLREIYGENAGAIEAMKMAYQAGLGGSEEASWAGNTLAHLFENTGDLRSAEATYNLILEQRPSYAFALNGLARIERNKGNYDKAISLGEKAAAMMPEFSFYEDMAEAYAAKGDAKKAKEIYTRVIEMLKEDAASGHYADLELALAYLKTADLENAMKHAKIEYDRRPQNIDVNSTMAWVMYQKGDYAAAKKYMKTAMRMGTQNAMLLCRAGIIEAAAGDKKAGKELIQKAMKLNPYLPTELTNLVKSV